MMASWCFQNRNLPGRIQKTLKRLSLRNDFDGRASMAPVSFSDFGFRISDFGLLRLRGARGSSVITCR